MGLRKDRDQALADEVFVALNKDEYDICPHCGEVTLLREPRGGGGWLSPPWTVTCWDCWDWADADNLRSQYKARQRREDYY